MKMRSAFTRTLEEYERLFGEIPDVNQIIHLSSIDGAGNTVSKEELNVRQTVGVNSLFNIVKAAKKIRGRQPIDIILVTDYVNQVTGREKWVKPDHAALIGLAKVIPKEYPEITCRTIDIDDFFTVKHLINELSDMPGSEATVYREGIRYLETYDQVVCVYPRKDVPIKEEGVYIITGGTGGLGLEFAKFISSKAKANIALLSRRPFPEKGFGTRL